MVAKSTGSWVTVRSKEDKKVECRLKGRLRIHGIRTTNPVAVGDYVQLDH